MDSNPNLFLLFLAEKVKEAQKDKTKTGSFRELPERALADSILFHGNVEGSTTFELINICPSPSLIAC